jgi:hypothetical protein
MLERISPIYVDGIQTYPRIFYYVIKGNPPWVSSLDR